MATLTPTKRQVRIKLNNGVDASGNVKTVSVQLPKLNLTATNEAVTTAISAIVNLLSANAIFSKAIYSTEYVQTGTITA